MKLVLKPKKNAAAMNLYYSAGSRYLGTMLSQKFWYSLKSTEGVKEE